MHSWLIVILINGWQWLDSCPNRGSIAASFLGLQSSMLSCLSGTEEGLSMNLSSHSSVYTLQPLPDPVNVLSVSSHSHTCTQKNYSVVKSCFKNLHHCFWVERKNIYSLQTVSRACRLFENNISLFSSCRYVYYIYFYTFSSVLNCKIVWIFFDIFLCCAFIFFYRNCLQIIVQKY